jgi:hypothetical protein
MATYLYPSDTKASPRTFRRYQRHAHYDRMRYSAQMRAWLTQQAERLESAGADMTIFDYLYSNTAFQITSAAHAVTLATDRVPNTGA